jgi:hypothetical protein
MKIKRRISLLAGGLFLGALGQVNAANLQIVGGTSAMIPMGDAANDLLNPIGLATPLSGFTDSSIELVGDSPILVEYFGKEAGYTNSFTLDGNTLTTSSNVLSGVPVASFVTGSLSGILDFVFTVDDYTGQTKSVANGSANENVGFDPNFFASIVGNPTGTSGDSIWLFLDDGGGLNDDDHDDMVMRISVVPLPASVWLLGTAVAGLAARRTLRRKT